MVYAPSLVVREGLWRRVFGLVDTLLELAGGLR